MVRIELSLYGDRGAHASIIDDKKHDAIKIAGSSIKQAPRGLCLQAAHRLRRLAEAFERLAEMPEPFKEVTQRSAMRSKS